MAALVSFRSFPDDPRSSLVYIFTLTPGRSFRLRFGRLLCFALSSVLVSHARSIAQSGPHREPLETKLHHYSCLISQEALEDEAFRFRKCRNTATLFLSSTWLRLIL
jgi:hypothetical protein